MTEYKLITADTPDDLNTKVNDHLSRHWILYGNPLMTTDDSVDWYGQALVRHEPPGRPA